MAKEKEVKPGKRGPEPSFFSLARKPDLDQETAFTICRMINTIGYDFVENWDWNWLDGKRRNYRSVINKSWVKPAWDRLFGKQWLSLQTANDHKKISTIAPLQGLRNLRVLVLQNNLIEDLRPLSSMVKLRELYCFRNRIRDLGPLRDLQHLTELSVGDNPVASLRVLEALPHLAKLSISADQVPALIHCKRLPALRILEISGDATIADFSNFPEMPRLKVFKACRARDLAGMERFSLLENLNIPGGKYGSLTPLQTLNRLTHLTITSSKTLNMEPLRKLFALRYLSLNCRAVEELACLSGLPVLHEIDVDDECPCNLRQLRALRKELTPWNTEFVSDAKGREPSLNLRRVDQKTFDYFDGKEPFGIRPGEFNEEMLASERAWLLEEIGDALSVKFEHDKDFVLPCTSGFRRSERVIIYTVETYESFREIALTVQQILCRARNNWIIYCQSLLWEGPEDQEIPEGAEDFIVWIYPDEIVATEEHAAVVRKLMKWRDRS
jgi:internalin A